MTRHRVNNAMPFDANTHELIGATFSIHPNDGFGWMRIEGAESVIDVPTPDSRIDVALDVVAGGHASAYALIARGRVEILGCVFNYISLIARSDYIIDLNKNSVGCNLLFTRERPFVNETHPPTHPAYVSAESYPQVRGFGVLSRPGSLLRRSWFDPGR